MGYKAASIKRTTATSTQSNQTVSIYTGSGYAVAGATVKPTTSISLGVVTPGSNSSASSVSVASGPAITSIQYLDANNVVIPGDIAVSTSGGNILINGSGFVANSTVYINNVAVANTLLSSTQIRATCPAASSGNVSLMIFTTSNIGTISPNGVRYSGVPSWTTAAVSFQNGSSANVALVASSDSTLTYTLQAGSTLPTGITLNSAGYLSGTATGYSTSTSSTIILIATDLEGQSAQQTITWTILVADPQFNYTSLLLNGETSATPFIADASTNNFGLTIAGDSKATKFSPYYGDGYYSNLFNGSTDYATVPANAGLTLGAGDFTIEAWIYTPLLYQTYGSGIIGTYDGGTNGGWSLTINRTSGGPYGIAFIHANAIQQSYATYLSTNIWHHIAVTRTNGTLKTFLDGVQVATGTYTTTDTVSAICYIGSQGVGQYHNGYISNLRVIKGTSLYSTSFTPSTTPLTAVANTSLLICQSNRFVDKSTNALAITAAGTPSVSSAIPFAASSSYATYGSAYFDGTGDWLLNATSSNLVLTGDFTVEAWINPANVSGTKGIMGIFGTGGGWYLGLNGAAIRFSTGLAGGDFDSGTVAANVWSHIAVTRSGNSLRVFLNGTQVNTTTDVSAQNFTISNPLYIGQINTAGWTYTGYISDVRINKGNALYIANFTPPTAPLTAVANTQLLTCQYNGGVNNYGIIDNGPFQNVITRVGNATQGTFSPYSQTGWSNYFPGSTSQASFTSNAVFGYGTGDFTWEMWFNPSSSPNGLYLLDHGAGNAGTISFNGSRLVYYNATTGVGSSLYTTGFGNSFSIGTWYHIAAVRRSGTTYLYLNGTLTTSATDTNSYPTAVCLIGQYGGGSLGFVGYISNVRLVKGAGVYTGNFTPPTAPLTTTQSASTNISAITAGQTSILTCQSNRFVDNSGNNLSVGLISTPSVQAYSPFSPATAYSPATNGGSCYFDGVGDYLTLTDPPAVAAGIDATIELWVYPTSFAIRNFIYSGGPAGAGAVAISLETTGAAGIWIDGYSSPKFSTTTANPSLNQWNHIALVKTSGVVYCYVNGVKDAGSYTHAAAFGSGTTLTIGAYNVNKGQLTFGYLSDVRYTKGVSVYTGATAAIPTAPLPPTTNTALLLNFTNGGIVDAHASNVLETIGGAQVSTAVKKFGTASMSFDGTTGYLKSPATALGAFGTGDFTIECWYYYTGGATGTKQLTLLSNLVASDNNTWDLQYYSTGFRVVAWSPTFVSGTATLTANTWNHIAVTRSGTTMTIWLNGASIGTAVNSTAFTTASAIKVGWNGSNDYWQGYIDDARITKGFARYTANFTAPTIPFLGQ